MTDSTDALLALSDRYFVPVYRPRRIVLDHGRGARLWDRDGVEYVDFGAGIAVNALGHAHPGLTAAIADQAAVPHVAGMAHHTVADSHAVAYPRIGVRVQHNGLHG